MIPGRVLALLVGGGLLISAPTIGMADDFIPAIPFLQKMEGPVLWGSCGWTNGASDVSDDRRNYFRGGFGLRFHPEVDEKFYERRVADLRDSLEKSPGGMDNSEKDLLKKWEKSLKDAFPDSVVIDSEATALEVTEGKERSAKTHYDLSHHTRKVPVTITLGYMADNGVKLQAPRKSIRLQLRGPYLGVFLTPGWAKWGVFSLFTGASAEFLDGKETSIAFSDTVLKIAAGQTVAPEVYLGTNFPVSSGVFGFVEGSLQYVRLTSITYEKQGASAEPDGTLISSLPHSASYKAWHLNVGITFSGKGLLDK